MAGMSISEVAKQVGLQASAIRYYERLGLLPAAHRVSGQRRYDETILYRLAIVRRATQLGFTLDEVRRLFFGFHERTPVSQRWQKLNRVKLSELETMVGEIRGMQKLLRRMMKRCDCRTLEQCGKGIFESASFRQQLA